MNLTSYSAQQLTFRQIHIVTGNGAYVQATGQIRALIDFLGWPTPVKFEIEEVQPLERAGPLQQLRVTSELEFIPLSRDKGSFIDQ